MIMTEETRLRFMVCYATDSVVEALRQVGQVVFRSSLVNWLVLEADESDEQRIAQVPGVLKVYRERDGVWLGNGWMTEETRQVTLKAMRELLPKAEADLASLREKLADKPELLPIYEPSALELIRRIKEQIELLETCRDSSAGRAGVL